MNQWVLLSSIGTLVASALLTGFVRRIAVSWDLLDIPNERSSHSIPTPRGGGLAIAVSYTLSALVVVLQGGMKSHELAALTLPGLLVAAVGFADDKWDVKARYRLVVHCVAAMLALYLLGGPPSVSFFDLTLDFGSLGWLLGVLYVVWMLNLYNFMDGINGLAAGEAITVCGGGAILFWMLGEVTGVYLCLMLALAALGFMFWNFPTAKIFMGDVGSGFLGLTLAVISLYSAKTNPDMLWAWLILLAVFIVDATVTLIVRFLRGERVYQAHRSHAFQIITTRLGSHTPVVISTILLNVLVLLPLSILVMKGIVPGLVGCLIAYAPLTALALATGAGRRDR